MFTGIVTAIGKLRGVRNGPQGLRLDISCPFEKLSLGESIAVNGVCLTAAELPAGGFSADASAETVARTTLGTLSTGSAVNLERALAVGDRLGGHIVAGHVDGVGHVKARAAVGGSERWTFEAPSELMQFIAEKGSIAIDGVSLTVNAIGPTSFEVMLVPFTLGATTLSSLTVGSGVNLEADVIARYVARALDAQRQGVSGGVSMALLERAGFVVK